MSDLEVNFIDKLKTLIYANTRISASYESPRKLLSVILESVKTVLSCEAASVLTVNQEDGSLTFDDVLGPKGAEVKKIHVEKESIAGWVAEHMEPQIVNSAIDDERFNPYVQNSTNYITRNMMAYPVVVSGRSVAVIEVLNKSDNQDFTQEDLDVLELIGMQAAVAYRNLSDYRGKMDQIDQMQHSFKIGNEYHSFVAKSPAVLDILKVIDSVAKMNSSVLIVGESGVGKELFAEQVHLRSDRKDMPFVRVNCGALSPTLLESELFGHVKGAFTDAVSNHMGRFEAADGGTIFLDEIGELPLDLQVKLLRVLQERKFERVGSSETISVNVRVIAATNRNLEEMVENGSFRSDLYFRLNVVPINVPPLRDRKEDLEVLSQHFLEKFRMEAGKDFKGFSEAAMEAINSYYWPGNIRELENAVERACILGTPPYIEPSDLHLPTGLDRHETQESSCGTSVLFDSGLELKDAVNEFKKEYITKVLIKSNWNQTEAARRLGIQRTYVSRLLNELDIKRV
ncbi:sigma-54-dependent Fis family transcriptional regulator [Treponema sp.]|uniref:sigma-54-dependent Fis family transcriptional regulator n=1 Tax=Treponema sp. TaxID=166 RepID=UPI002580D6A3|nr:sigma-54-dependent Fis family transcriptional regulator [Treponema sp.]MBE6354586.1 sigma-54-dependent Fis family transcriptional regulator [Treponema sp.]